MPLVWLVIWSLLIVTAFCDNFRSGSIALGASMFCLFFVVSVVRIAQPDTKRFPPGGDPDDYARSMSSYK